MLVINGKKFARNRSEMIDTLFQADGTACGTYRKVKGGVQLFNLQGELFACIVDNRHGQGLVTATRQDNGKAFYMFDISSVDARYLGLEDASHSEVKQAVRDALETVK